ncbi:acetyl-CoA carboxylase biotin carboxyl carrier protein [Inquilinus sp. CAU 1745]|uniref:acetyl-CoA carboxylase biotin carboxyl carrier protein n=1 Tax=Inquilinus sp. CAU 1745 TaxID=3140369 RepID=UPI00325C1597
MASFDIDGDFIRKLADLLQETGLSEIEFQEGDKRLRISRPTVAQAFAAAAPAPAPAQPAAEAGPPANALTSPMVGTAYLAPEPSAPPFVKVGDAVKEGQTVLIVEAMKVMNPIRAPRAGIVSQVLVTDGQPVEFGEPLLVIE